MSNRRSIVRLLIALLALVLLAAACGSDRDDDDDAATEAGNGTESTDDTAGDDDASGDDASGDDAGSDDAGDDDDAGGGEDPPEETTPPEEADPCEGVTLEATETGVTADTITIVAMADVDSPLAPGLFAGAWDGVNAWAAHVNAEGGIGCRMVEVIEADAMLNATETTNGFLRACEDALALVGTTVLFGNNTEDLNSCPDAAGNPIGVPDLAYITTEPPHQCSANSFHMSRPGAECPYAGEGVRNHTVQIGAVSWLLENSDITDPNGIFMVPSDLPSTITATIPQYKAHAEIGVTYDATPGVSGRATQAEFTPLVQTLRENDADFIYNGSNDQSMIKLLSEADAQGLDLSGALKVCSLSCYTPDFIEQGGAVVEGTYVWMSFVPFAEVDDHPELADFIDAVGDPFPAAWAAGAWADGVLLEAVIADIVATDGPNGITRASVLDGLRGVTEFDANGWWGRTDFSTANTISDCFVLLQVQDGAYERVHPEAPGTLDCDSSQSFSIQADPSEFQS